MSGENPPLDFQTKATPYSIKPKATPIVKRPDDCIILDADHAHVLIDTDCGICTFIFFRRHVKPKYEPAPTDPELKLLTFSEVVDEDYLEVKVPFSTTLPFAIAIQEAFKHIFANPSWRGQVLAPAFVESTNR